MPFTDDFARLCKEGGILAMIFGGLFFLSAKVRYISLLQEILCCQTHQPD
jgi:hypothetical protein